MASRRMTDGALPAGLAAGSGSTASTRGGGGATVFSRLPDHIPTRRFSTLHSPTTDLDASREYSATPPGTEASSHKYFGWGDRPGVLTRICQPTLSHGSY